MGTGQPDAESGQVSATDARLGSIGLSLPPASGTGPAVVRAYVELRTLIEEGIQRGNGHLYEEIIAAVERLLFTRVLQHTHGHQARASELLGMDRSTLRTRLKSLGLSIDKTLTGG